MTSALLIHILIGGLNILDHSVAHAKLLRPKTQCDVREPHFTDPDWTCAKASQWMTTQAACIPAEAFKNWGCLEVDVNAKLCAPTSVATTPFNLTAYMTTSHVTLDCNHQTITHAPAQTGIHESAIRFPYQKSIEDVTVKKCIIKDVSRYGVDLKRIFRGAELATPETLTGHHAIKLNDLWIRDTGGIGIYVGQNSSHGVFENIRIERAFMGFYLEAGSHHHRISGARISHTRVREGIAVDSSSYNTIENSTFSHMTTGDAIRFYKNCGEERGQVCPIVRTMDASHNTIKNNIFLKSNVSVGFRQGKLYTGGWCGSITRALGRWRDRAPHNHFEKNLFAGAKLDIQDGPITIIKNYFTSGSEIEIGAHGPLGEHVIPIAGSIKNNRFDSDVCIDYRGPKRAFKDLEIIP